MIRRLFALAVLAAALASGCAEPPALQTIRFRELAYFEASEDWVSQGQVDGELRFVHAEDDDIVLWVGGDSEQIGAAITTGALRSLLGREANLEYGGATSRLSMAGNAVIRFASEGEAQDEPSSVRWWVARPWGGSHILKIDVSIEYPAELDPAEIEPIIESLDPLVADARFPSADA